MNKYFVPVLVILVVLALAYAGRTRLKSMLGGELSPTPVAMTNTASPTSTSKALPSDNIYISKTDPNKGSYMTDFQGMTLYTFDKDTNGISNCYNGCAKAWPVYTSGATAQGTFPTNISVITRTDGTKQFAWKGMPLYYYVKDLKAGDITGDGVGGTWHIVKPE